MTYDRHGLRDHRGPHGRRVTYDRHGLRDHRGPRDRRRLRDRRGLRDRRETHGDRGPRVHPPHSDPRFHRLSLHAAHQSLPD